MWLSLLPRLHACLPGSVSERGVDHLMAAAGASVRTCFCGPCFGAGDVPANGAFSIRHSTRNFPNREGSKPSDGQICAMWR